VRTTTWYTVGGLTNGARYYFRVVAKNAAGFGVSSNVVEATPLDSSVLAVIAETGEAELATTAEQPVASSTTSSIAVTDPTTTVAAVPSTVTTVQAPPTEPAVPPTEATGSTASTTTATAAPTSSAAEPMPETSPAPETTSEAASAPIQAANCPAIGPADVELVNGALGVSGAGLTVAMGTAADDGATRYIVGGIYDGTGSLVSGPETWVVVAGELLALSEGATRHSGGVRDARTVLVGPTEGFNSQVQTDLQTCVEAALAAG
jgi:hypothetical protein